MRSKDGLVLLSQLQQFGGDPVAGSTGRAEEAEAAATSFLQLRECRS